MTIRISAELSHICPPDEIAAHAALLEDHGFYRVWVPDTVVSPWEAWLAASIILHRTDRIRIGLGVTNPYTRHPVVTAQMASTMQGQSGGRLALSIGKGIGRFLEKAGIKQHTSAVEEYIGLLRPLIAGERTSFSGDVFHIDGIKLRTPPPSTPVEIYMAAIGPAGWECAVRTADGIATFWNDQLEQTRQRFTAKRRLPVAVLVPFALSRPDFFEGRITDPNVLRQRIEELDRAGFDEVIIAYADQNDLETAGRFSQKQQALG